MNLLNQCKLNMQIFYGQGDLVRVISGSRKGRSLKAVPGYTTRPTSDKVKEAIFNIIGPYFSGGHGLDLFAGSGALGIEGLSRGLDKVIFIDHDGKAIQTIKQNIQQCQFRDQAEIYKNDWQRALKSIIRRKLVFSIIWLDPPYKKNIYQEILKQIDYHQLLADDGVVICEHTRENSLPEQIGKLKKWKYEEYGTTAISIYQKMSI